MKEQAQRIDGTREKVKVCVVAHLFPARSETFFLEHVMGLVRRGLEVTVIAKDYDRAVLPPELERIDEAGVKRIYVGNYTSFSTKVTKAINALRAVRAVLRSPAMYGAFRHRAPWTVRDMLIAHAISSHIDMGFFDLVHIHFGDLAARVQLVASRLKAFPPVVVTWHGSDANAIPNRMGVNVYRRLFESNVRHTVGTQFILERLLALGALPLSLSKIPMGTDIARFSYIERSLRNDEVFRILSVGRLDEVKGHKFLIDALAELRGMGRNVRLRIGGDGPMREVLAAQIKTLGLEREVELLGAIDSDTVIREMHAAHLFALSGCVTPSGKVENQGVVLQEAQATGLPVVASRAGGVPESVLEGKTGILCEPGNVDDVCRAIDCFIKDRSLLLDYGKNGRVNIEKNFSNDVMHSRMLALYEELLGSRIEAQVS